MEGLKTHYQKDNHFSNFVTVIKEDPKREAIDKKGIQGGHWLKIEIE